MRTQPRDARPRDRSRSRYRAEFTHTLARLVDFHLAEIIDGRLGVYTSLPPLTRRQTDRLPDHLAQRHRALAIRRHDRSPYAARLSAEVSR